MRALLLLGVLADARRPGAPGALAYPRAEEAKPLREQIIGDWAAREAGIRHAAMELDAINHNAVLRITPSETIFMVNGQPSQGDGLTANYSIDWARNPIAIDFMPKQRGGKMPGILMLDGDTLIPMGR